jgi:hypothetical protein
VIDKELVLAAEQIGERLFAGRSVEHIGLVDLHPRQVALLGAQRIARLGEFLFLGEERFAGFEPFAL